MAIIFERYLHSRPFTQELNAFNGTLGAEWDYGGKLTAAVAALDQWPVKLADLSYWQGAIDFSILKTKVQIVILRAVYGNKTIDANFDKYYRDAKDQGLEVMCYHYLKPGANWLTHAQTAIAVEKDYPCLQWWGDFEENGGLGKTALEGWIYKYYDKIGASMKRIGHYTSKGFNDANLNKTNWLKNLDLWIAAWTTASQPLLPLEWVAINNPRTWKLWQWTSKGDGVAHGVSSRYIDLNRYNGSIADFNLDYKTNIVALPSSGSVTPPPPPPPDPEPVGEYEAIMLVDGMNVRYAPATNNLPFAKGVKGQKVVVAGSAVNGYVPVKAYLYANSLKKV